MMTTIATSESNLRERMNDAALRHLPCLMRFADRCQEQTAHMVQAVAPQPDDDLGCMTLAFVQRQSEHLRTLIALIPRKDTLLIARSMVEGYAQLLWAAQEPEVRAKRWRAHVWVGQWRVATGLAKAGFEVDPEKLAEIERAIRRNSSLLLNGVGQKAIARGAPLQDHYLNIDWRCGVNLRRTLLDIASHELVDVLFSSYSDWPNWGAWEIGQCMNGNPEQACFTGESPKDAASALTMGVRSAARTLRFADDTFRLRGWRPWSRRAPCPASPPALPAT